MQDDLVQFAWQAPTAGYRWIEATATSRQVFEPFLVSLASPGLTRHKLSEHPGLFRELAETDPTRDAILSFANRYGTLEGRLLRPRDKNEGFDLGFGDPLELWKQEIHALHQAAKLWDLVQAQDVSALSQHFHWQGNDVIKVAGVLFDLAPDYKTDEAFTIVPPWKEREHRIPGQFSKVLTFGDEFWEQISPADVLRPAMYYVRSVVNAHIQGRVSPRLLWNARKARMTLHLCPARLLGALWLQLAEAINGNKRYRACRQCGSWFELSPRAARISRVFCSDACRIKSYRNRQMEARRLHADGIPLREIAKRLDSSATTIEGWVEHNGSPDRNSGDTG